MDMTMEKKNFDMAKWIRERWMILLGLSFVIYHLSFSVACSDDDLKGYLPEAETIRIVQNDLLFEAGGGSATVVVDADGTIAATADADWCAASVSGRVVTVTAQPNGSFEGRTALLTLTAGDARRQLPVQQTGMALDMPLTTTGHHSPAAGEVFDLHISHSMPLNVSSPQTWIHPEVDGNTLRITVDDNSGGHLRRGLVACECSGFADTLRISQYDMRDDVVGSYYMMGYYGGNGGAPAATRFNIIMRNDSLLMNWPQERYADAYIPITFDEATCTLFIPSGFTLYSDAGSSVYGFFYDTNGTISTSASASAYLSYNASTGYNSAALRMADWPGHELSGFIIRSVSIVSTTIFQLGSPVLMRVGPEGTTLESARIYGITE